MREVERQAPGIPELIKHLQDADRYRRAMQPSSPGYHRAAEEVERLSRRIFEQATAEEEEEEARRQAPRRPALRTSRTPQG
jgi:hypothetical protein